MEHITIKNLGNGMVKITPDKGYMLYDNRTQKQYSEAVVEESLASRFLAVKIQ